MIDPALRLRTPAELSAGLRAVRDHLRTLDSASPEAALMNEAALYLDGATDSLREHMAMVRQAQAEVARQHKLWRTAAGISNECTWNRSTRPIADRLQKLIREAFEGARDE